MHTRSLANLGALAACAPPQDYRFVGHTLHSKENATKGEIESKGTGRLPDQLMILDMKHGVEAKNYEELGRAEKLRLLEVRLRCLEDLSESVVNDFASVKK